MSLKTLGVALLSTLAITATAEEYPDRDILGVVMWGAGGATDVVARAINPHAEAELGQSIVVQNRPGGAGAISTTFVNATPADGYTLLYGAENPQLHPVMGISDLDYSNFYPVSILGLGTGVIVVPADSDYESMQDLLDAIQANPGQLNMGSTGPGGIPGTISAMISNVTEFDVNPIQYGGEGPGITAMLGGEVDFMPAGVSAAAGQIEAGTVRALAVVDTEPMAAFPGVPAITETLPDMANYLPWGPFYGVFIKDDSPDEVKARLTEAFSNAAEQPDFRNLMEARGNIMMNISGDEAREFLDTWQRVTAWAMWDTGGAEVNPETLGIARP